MSNTKTPTRRAGRPRTMQGDVMTASLRMTRAQRQKLDALGGAAWVREQIDLAQVPVRTAPVAG